MGRGGVKNRVLRREGRERRARVVRVCLRRCSFFAFGGHATAWLLSCRVGARAAALLAPRAE